MDSVIGKVTECWVNDRASIPGRRSSIFLIVTTCRSTSSQPNPISIPRGVMRPDRKSVSLNFSIASIRDTRSLAFTPLFGRCLHSVMLGFSGQQFLNLCLFMAYRPNWKIPSLITKRIKLRFVSQYYSFSYNKLK